MKNAAFFIKINNTYVFKEWTKFKFDQHEKRVAYKFGFWSTKFELSTESSTSGGSN